ncbi:class I mannose-6-phosphate isomerase [Acerihabitans arboris]|uniref:Mannose-6-phosphate isomerase n=1 Tax=Acerihabitans arboris TaxID=2691583 RepID=A0A845SL23_9GAMM|nr:class I mannose-6-phosphate isomerase [Acerihabitans arboris]NDL62005.1 mannose-6-phosphate isomerase [Acerihabitans arboris]
MEKQIFKIEPFFEPRIWGGERLKKRYGYTTDISPVGEVYNVVALPGQADCVVTSIDKTLSQLYVEKQEWFKCDTVRLPIRVNILDPLADLSVQLHPGDEYALKHDNSRGKPEAWVILNAPEDGRIAFGHYAKSREEFSILSEKKEFDKLVRYIPAKKDWYLDIPAGTLHAIGKDVLTYNISRNADLTYRLYDYNRIDPKTDHERQLHIDKVIDNVIVPDDAKDFIWFDSTHENGCEISRYWNEPGLYTLLRLKTITEGHYSQPRFAFITIVEGSGRINGISVKKGETILIPDNFGTLIFRGKIDCFIASYENE